MAEVLILAGESAWIQSRALKSDEICVQHISEKSPNTLVQIAFRPGRVPYDGGYGFSNGVALAWIGDWRNRAAARDLEGISAGTIAEELSELWKLRGKEMFANVHGLMACVLWDESTGQLYAFRDKIGLVPMVYTMDPATRSIVISSDADWLLDASCLPRVVNRARLTKFLLNSDDCGRDDFIQGLNRIRSRECLIWSKQTLTTENYWNPVTNYLPPSDDYSRQFRELLCKVLDSLGNHSRVYELSGGLDSSSLVAIAVERQNQNENPEVSPIRTVSIVAPGHPRTDESIYINEIVEYLKTNSRYFSISDHWPLQDLDLFKAFWGSGPYFHPEEHYMREYYQWINKNYNDVDVISGGGADQLLYVDKKDYIHCLIERQNISEVMMLFQMAGWRRTVIVSMLEFLNIKKILKKVSRFVSHDGKCSKVKSPWCAPEGWVNGNETVAITTKYKNDVFNCGDAKIASQQSWLWELACRGIYRKSVRTNTRFIFPYLDDRVWEFGLCISPLDLRHNGRNKGLLRSAIKNMLPRNTIWNFKVGGFDQLIEYGLSKDSLLESVFISKALDSSGIIRYEKFYEAFLEYKEKCQHEDRQVLRSFPLWFTIAAELWMQQV